MHGECTDKITGKESVIAKLGYWPEFCDAKFLEFGFCHYVGSAAHLSMLLHYIDTEKGLDLNVRIVLSGIIDMEFDDLVTENVVDRINLIPGKDGAKCEIEAAYGLHGECSCAVAHIELVSKKTC